jgi:hypothetical protein
MVKHCGLTIPTPSSKDNGLWLPLKGKAVARLALPSGIAFLLHPEQAQTGSLLPWKEPKVTAIQNQKRRPASASRLWQKVAVWWARQKKSQLLERDSTAFQPVTQLTENLNRNTTQSSNDATVANSTLSGGMACESCRPCLLIDTVRPSL